MSRYSDFDVREKAEQSVESELRRRARGKEAFPVLIGEAMPGVITGRPLFPFISWASAVGFKYPAEAQGFYRHCGSAAEAYFLQPFVSRGGFVADGRTARAGGITVELQSKAGPYFIDALVSDPHSRLAVEVDGIGFHHRSKEQVAADYLRERRIVLQGYTVIRFTAQEAFALADECWRQIEAILTTRRKGFRT